MRYVVWYQSNGKTIQREYNSRFVYDEESAIAHVHRGARVYNGCLRPGEYSRKPLRIRLLDVLQEPRRICA